MTETAMFRRWRARILERGIAWGLDRLSADRDVTAALIVITDPDGNIGQWTHGEPQKLAEMIVAAAGVHVYGLHGRIYEPKERRRSPPVLN